jgi:hypothetical protein
MPALISQPFGTGWSVQGRAKRDRVATRSALDGTPGDASTDADGVARGAAPAPAQHTRRRESTPAAKRRTETRSGGLVTGARLVQPPRRLPQRARRSWRLAELLGLAPIQHGRLDK